MGARLTKRGVVGVPGDGGVRLGLCAGTAGEIPALVGALAATL